jgi:hypothetical protein
MNEWIIIGVVVLGSALFAIGGTGFKFVRRFIMPVVLATGAFLLGIIWWRCLIMACLTISAMHLGYGENQSLWRKILTVLSFSICLLPLATGLNGFLTLITPLFFGLSYWLSRKFNWWTWKLVELTAGFNLGLVVVLLAMTQ